MELGETTKLHNRKRLCASYLKLQSEDAFLDLGSGESGELLNHALLAECRFVLAIDIDATKLTRARNRSGRDVHFVRASGTNLPLRERTFDKIAMIEVLEHLPKGKEVESLREISRVLNDRGKLFVSTPNKFLPFIILDPAFVFGHRHYSAPDVGSALIAGGLKPVSIGTYGGTAEAIMTPAFYLMRRLRSDLFEMPKSMLKKVDNEYGSPRAHGYTLVADCAK